MPRREIMAALGVLGVCLAPHHRRSPAANPSRGVFGSPAPAGAASAERCDPARRLRPRPRRFTSCPGPLRDAFRAATTSAWSRGFASKRVGSSLGCFDAPKRQKHGYSEAKAL